MQFAKSTISRLLFGLVLSFIGATLASAACRAPGYTDAEKSVINATRIDQSLFNSALLKAVNYERCRKNRAELSSDPTLIAMAQAHSEEMAREGYFSHTSPHSATRDVGRRADRANLRRRIVGENIALNQRFSFGSEMFITKGTCRFVYQPSRAPVPEHSYASLAQTVVAQWMGSRGHKANILHKRYKRHGAAIGYDKNAPHCGNYLVTQNFAG